MTELVIVGGVVLIAAAWVAWRLWRTLRGRSGCGCGCDSCEPEPTDEQ